MPTQVVDTATAREFMQDALTRITETELGAIAGECEAKHGRFRALLAPAGGGTLPATALRPLLRSIFATRRRVDEVLARTGEAPLAAWMSDLVGTEGPVEERFQTFVDRLEGLDETLRRDLASELLHFTDPERYWLWTRWVWDPRTRTGALPLVTTEDYDLAGDGGGDAYLRVGRAMAFVRETGRAAGLAGIGESRFGIDVYLACVYGVYVYTTIRLRLTQEFNRVLPSLPELCRRLLGVHRLEV
jgi:hypothetical protein